MANSIYHLVPAADFRAQPESQPCLPPAFAADRTPPQPGDSPRFPPIYGSLNRDAITDIRVAARSPEAAFISL